MRGTGANAVLSYKLKSWFFRKRGQLKDDERWFYSGTLLNLTDDFNHLGCIFHYTGTFTSHAEHVGCKSSKKNNKLFNGIKVLGF